VQRQALRLHYLAGDRAGAIRRFEQFRALLADEMGVPPMDDTQVLYDAIITDTVNPALLPSPAPDAGAAAGPPVRPRPGIQTLPFIVF
jgi:hypothetical protein